MILGSLQWRHNEHDGAPNYQPYDCLLNRLFRRRSKKLRVTGLCAGNSPATGEFPAQRASNTENVFHLMTSSWCTYGWGSRGDRLSMLFLFRWPPCQRSDMTLVEVSQRASKALCIGNSWPFVSYGIYVNLTRRSYPFLLNKLHLGLRDEVCYLLKSETSEGVVMQLTNQAFVQHRVKCSWKVPHWRGQSSPVLKMF